MKAVSKREESAADLQRLYGQISHAREALREEYELYRHKVASLRVKAERSLRKKALKDFHNTADLEHVLRQLKGDMAPTVKKLPPIHILGERCEAARLFLKPMTDALFADLVATLSSLSSGFEGAVSKRASDLKRKNNQVTEATPHSAPETSLHSAQSAESPPAKRSKVILHVRLEVSVGQRGLGERKTLTSLTCLICYGNRKRGTSRPFSRSDGLRRHYARHF